MNTQQYKKLKGLKKQNLRDNISTTELILNMLAETSTTDISKEEKPTVFEENQEVEQPKKIPRIRAKNKSDGTV